MGFGSLFKKDETETRNELLGKGLELLASGKNEKAMKWFDKAIPLLPEFAATVWNFKGITFTRLENAEEAMECFDKAIELEPEFVDAWLNKGYTLHHLGKREESIVCIRKVLELDPNNELALTNIKAFGYEEYF